MVTIRYTEWDGTQQLRFSTDRVFEKLAEYLSCTDDVQQAFEWLLRHGLDVEEAHVIGLEELLDQVRSEMRARYERYNLDHALDELRRRLDELLALERATLNDRGAEDPAVLAKRQQIDRVPQRLSDAIEYLRGYDFEDDAAATQFQDLLDELESIRACEEFQRRYGELFRGSEALGYEEALEVMEALRRLKQLEDELLANDVERISVEELGSLLGAALARQFGQLRQLVTRLNESGYLSAEGGRMQLSPKGVRRIGQLALREIYQGLLRDRSGSHEIDHRGVSEVQPEVTKPYMFGDAFNLDLPRTFKNALARGCGTPLGLRPEDFEVHETHHATTTSTVLLLDMSWSMSWEGRFAAAKKVAMALESLIRTRYPHDYFGIVGFYTRATELKVRELPEASWNMGDPFTNLQDGLRLASDLLRRHPSTNRYMIVITDGQPTAYFLRGRLYCEWPLSFGGISMCAAQETLREVERVTRRGIVINTFMLDDSPSLRAFVERMTRINKGRALFTRPGRLGEYLLVDYIARKRKRV
jgi:uncharacterized protein with von Willebrand factor type A (vWA) domain